MAKPSDIDDYSFPRKPFSCIYAWQTLLCRLNVIKLSLVHYQQPLYELPADPAEVVKDRLREFTQRWEEELNNFHPNIINFIMDVEDSNPGKVKGLIKVHKEVREDGKHPIRLLLTSCQPGQ